MSLPLAAAVSEKITQYLELSIKKLILTCASEWSWQWVETVFIRGLVLRYKDTSFAAQITSCHHN